MGIKSKSKEYNSTISINKISLSFKSIEFERKFRVSNFKKSLPVFRIAFVLVTALYLGFGFFDPFASALHYKEFYFIRFAIIFPLLVIVLFLSYSKFFPNYWQELLMICFIIGGIGIVYMIAHSSSLLFYYGGLFLVFLAGFFFIRLRFLYATFSAIIILFVYNLFLLIHSTHFLTIEFHISNVFYVGTILIASFASYYIEKLERIEFYQNHILLEQQARISQINNNLEKLVHERTKDLENAMQKSEESNRLKTAFLQNMSHEIRTPLNSIVGFSKLITIPNLPKDKLEKFSSMISLNSDKLIGIITDVIEISQIQANMANLNLAELELVSFVKTICSEMDEKAIEKGLSLNLILPNEYKEYRTFIDSEKLRRILYHLIDNAIKFTAEGFIQVELIIYSKSFKIIVTDSGIGISPKMQKIIFEPFRQVELGVVRNFGGNGLGLSISKSYTELLDGNIAFESEINKGSTFIIEIPLKPEPIQLAANEKGLKSKAVITILIVEDEYSNYQYIYELLADTGYELLHAENGKLAIDMCRENKSIDLILMDVKMPVMDGHTAARLIKSFRMDVPVIALTDLDHETDWFTFKEVFDDHITKPINEEILKQKLAKFIANKGGTEE
jgi:signal transduction histidine kinase/CheY-like chemotaxis protein